MMIVSSGTRFGKPLLRNSLKQKSKRLRSVLCADL